MGIDKIMDELNCIVIDDEKHIRMFLKKLLKAEGINIIGEAANGAEGVEVFKELRPDIVFMDVNMPVKTGDEALQEMKIIKNDSFIVMLTSVADMETVRKCIEAGADFYIRKDTPANELKVIVNEILDEIRGV